MRQKLLETIGRLTAEKTWWMLAAIIFITLVFGIMAGNLEMSMNLTDILPEDDPMVEEFNYIFKEFNGASTIFVVVEGEINDMIRFAEHISPMIKDLDNWIPDHASEKIQNEHRVAMNKVKAGKIEFEGRYIDRVDYKMPVEFMQDHGLMLIKPSDLKNIRGIFTNPNLSPFLTNLNNSLEKEYIKSEEKLSTTQREQNAVRFLDGIESWVDNISNALYSSDYSPQFAEAAANAITVGTPYMISPDRSMLLIMAEPTFTVMEMDFVIPCINGFEKLVKSEAQIFNVSAGLAGGMALGRDEYVAGMEDSMLLTILAMIAVFILFIITFKMLSSPLLAILNLIIGLVWAMGISWLLVGILNMFTAMMAVVLIGLGIDFSIHIISVFSELVNKGVDPKKAIIETLKKVGPGIITGGLTTSAAFLTLMIAHSRGIFEFGLVCGIGLIVIMIATLVTLPTMLMVRERYRRLRKKEIKNPKDVSYATIGNFSENIYKRWKFSLIALVLLTIFFGIMISRVTMDYNYLNMEPEGLESIILNEKVIDKFNFSSDVTMMTAKSMEENYRLTEAIKEKSSISYVESISDYLPTVAEQQNRQKGVQSIYREMASQNISNSISKIEWSKFVNEMERLEMNVIELQDMAFQGGQDQVDDKATRLVGNPDQPEIPGNLARLIGLINKNQPTLSRLSRLNRDYAGLYKQAVLNMADTTKIRQDMLPQMIKNKFVSEKGDRYLITIYPKGNVWSIDYLEVFTNEVLDISPNISGMPPMFYYMLKIIGEDGRRAAFLTLAVVFIFLLIDFRSIKYAFFAMLPLVFGLIWTVGLMGLAGIQFTLLNIMAIPLILGIGIDDGVHILHRYRVEGPDSINIVYRSTGKAIIITSLTTMLAFGSLVFATYRGFGSLGLALFIGVGMCLLTTIMILPAILAISERKK